MLSDAYLRDFRRFMQSGVPLPVVSRQHGAYDASPGETPDLSASEEDETPPDRIEKWLTFLARRLTPEAWSALQQHLKKSRFDESDFATADGRHSSGSHAMDSAPHRRSGSAATRAFLRRFPAAANIRTN